MVLKRLEQEPDIALVFITLVFIALVFIALVLMVPDSTLGCACYMTMVSAGKAPSVILAARR